MRLFSGIVQIPLFAHLVAIWNRLIEPDSSVVDPDERESARVLSGLLLFGITLVIAILLISGLIGVPFSQYGPRIVLVIPLYVLVIISRRGQTEWLGTVIAFACTGVTLVIAYIAGGRNGLNVLNYLVLPIVAGTLYIPRSRLLLLLAVQIAGILAYAAVAPDIPPDLVLRYPLLFVTTVGLIGIFFNYYFRHGEANRRVRLAESEFRFRQMAENSTANFWLVDMRTFDLLYTSPAYETIWGQPLPKLPCDNRFLAETVHPEDVDQIWALQDVLMQPNSTAQEMEYRIIRPDGETRWLRTRFFPVKDQDGKVYRIAGITEDTTESRQNQQQAFDLALERKRIEIMTSFITDASHEFRTPLTIIHSSVYLAGRIDDPQHRQTHLNNIQQQADDILRLVEELVILSQLDSGHPLNNKESLCINTVVDGVYTQVKEVARAHNLDISCDFDPNLPPVEGDAEALHTALEEIVNNALRYTSAGGQVDIRTFSADDLVMVEIRDTGMGIHEADLSRVFERFYRGDAAHSTRGFGLGLTIAQAIVRQHQGRISVTSQPGVGTTVTVSLPDGRP
jgi:PAS domain S-box-containing protein